MDVMSGARTRGEPQPEVDPEVTAKMKSTRATVNSLLQRFVWQLCENKGYLSE